jgi:uncharacterized protein YkwD
VIAAAVALLAMTAPADDRGSVEAAYIQQLERESVPFVWSGDIASCVAGAPSEATQQATLDSVNYVRGLAGLGPVRLDARASAEAQAAALMMAANGELSHSPTRYWRCSTPEGIAGAGRSNLSMGATAARAVTGYMHDDGSNNQAVGHRTWLLQPGLASIGIGSTPSTNAIAVFGEGVEYLHPAPEAIIRWPNAGSFPTGLTPSRWSLTTTAALQGDPAGWDKASVTITKAGRIWTAPVIHRDEVLVWYMDDTTPGWYHVRVSAGTTYEYDVDVFDPSVRMTSPPRIKGTVRARRVVKLAGGSWTPASSQMSVTWKAGRRTVSSAKRLRIKPWMVGRKLTARVTASWPGLQPASLTLSGGRVRR